MFEKLKLICDAYRTSPRKDRAANYRFCVRVANMFEDDSAEDWCDDTAALRAFACAIVNAVNPGEYKS